MDYLKSDEKDLVVFERKMLYYIIGLMIISEGWRIKKNRELPNYMENWVCSDLLSLRGLVELVMLPHSWMSEEMTRRGVLKEFLKINIRQP